MRFRAQKEVVAGGTRSRGFGLKFQWGSSGSTYGQPGRDMFLTVEVAFWRVWTLNWTWKDLSHEEA
ncbi:hypothetical protein [Myxococcus phage Mx1]|nr:hypothetical protein [Myxococcus phage Mx1]